MKNLWNNNTAKNYIAKYNKINIHKDLALRIYTTHLLGNEKKLVLHGGGNTSVKLETTDIFNNLKKVIYVKGSGWDMSNLNHLGMPGLYLDPLKKTSSLTKMSDENMVNYLRLNLLDSNSPNPSVETLLHALLPHKYVDHTHSNAILSLVNLKNSSKVLNKIFGKKLAIVPYIMPGFQLAKKCFQIFRNNKDVEGLLLLNHGIFTFGDDAKQSYDRMIKYVSLAERYINNKKRKHKYEKNKVNNFSLDLLIQCRKIFYQIDKNKWIVNLHSSKDDIKFSLLENIDSLFTKGPVTPDHVIRIKSQPLIIKQKDLIKINKNKNNLNIIIKKYCQNYINYFQKNKNQIKNSKISDTIPRIIILQGIGYLSIGRNKKEIKISNDIFLSMKQSILDSCFVGTFKSINQKEIFKMEYWPLERAKLNNKKRNIFEGSVALITGGAGTIGQAIAKKFINEGLEIVLFDKYFNYNKNQKLFDKCLCIECDITNNNSIQKSINKVIQNFGGIDILVSNAGAAFQGSMESINEKIIKKSFDINFFSHQKISQKIVSIMKIQDMGGSIMFNISKQAVNPGKNFGPYGLAKTSTLFLMKQYALECGQYNIRVNGVNADRIQSGLLTKKFIAQRSKARNISPDQYLSNNLLQQEVLAEDVADAFFNQILLKKTTGNIITVDGGNIEASLR